jgi:hypothetical protein
VKLAAPLFTALVLGTGVVARAEGGGDSLRVSLLTMGPGREVFERFGHNAIRVQNLSSGMDSSYNWGVFDFGQPHFLMRFLTGDTRYSMEGYPTTPMVSWYRNDHRAVWEQDLALSAAEKDALWRYIQWNGREENKYYRYDYYLDNCSTRVRDVIDRAIGGRLQRATTTRGHGVSFRSETLRLAAAFPVLNLGMDFALGPRADSTLTAWREMFIPMRLQDHIRGVRVLDASGREASLVTAERQLVVDSMFAERAEAPSLMRPALAVGVVLGLIILTLGRIATTLPAARWGFVVVGGGWHALAGLVGPFVFVLGLWTKHVYMSQNVNLLLATPVSLALALIGPLALWQGAKLRAARALAAFTVAAGGVALLLNLVPAVSPENGALLSLALPVHASIAIALWRWKPPAMAGTP